MFEIPRPRLVSELWELTRRGSVMLSGAPGVGKSWLLGQLTQRCNQESRLVTTLVAEDFQVSTLQEIFDGLGFSKPLPKLLASLASPVLIIDGLDALRGDSSQRAFRELINEVVEQAPNASIVASVRTFDLQESPELQRLLNRYSGSGQSMNKLVVGELSDAELLEAAKLNQELLLLIVDNSEPLFELLRNPFNLHLALSLLSQGIPATELQSVQSQVQLLEKYWAYRVVSSPEGPLKERVLREISERMVESKTLSVPESEVAQPGFQEPLRAMKSAEVLRKSTTGRLSYSHNILFDYAISRLLLDEYRIFDFVKTDAARSLFFRPSLTFFFHRLWAFDRELFWKVTSRALSTSDIPERLRVLPAVALSEAALSSKEIDPESLQESLGALSTSFISLLLRAVLALKGFEGKRKPLWLGWLLSLSTEMRIEWINEVLTALSVSHSNMLRAERDFVGRIARSVLRWELGPPEGLNENQALNLSSVATGRLLPIIADTYETDPSASDTAIGKVIERVGEPGSASNEAFWLANIAPTVIQKSPTLAETLYLALYSYGEESEETTSMGGGVIMNFTSTRKQDFSSALYGLMSTFQLFLDRDSVRAARVAIKAAERETFRERIKEETESFGTKGYERSEFKFRGRLVTYQADYSEIWDGGSSRDITSLTLLDSALEFASKAQEPVRAEMIDEVCRYASLGISWKRLMTRAKLHPEALYAHVKDLLFIPKFISAPEVSVDVGEVLKAAYERNLVSEPDAHLIEQAIVRIAKTKIIRRYERPATIQQRLAGCLNQDTVTNPILIDRLKRWQAEAKTRENKPFHRSSFGAFSPSLEDEYRRSGIDPDSGPNAAVIAAVSKVREFESRHFNSVPTNEDVATIGPALQELYHLARVQGVSPEVAENGRGTLYAAVNAISKNPGLGADSELVQLCRTYALEGTADPSPVFDPKYHMPFDSGGWGSPSPRIEALQALGQLIWNYFSDEEIVNAFCHSANDEVPAVRYQVARYLPGVYKQGLKEKFWETLNSMLQAEPTSGVILALLHSLQAVAGLEPQRTMDAVEQLMARGLPPADRSESRQALIGIPIGLFVVQGHDRAWGVLTRFANDPAVYKREISDGIFLASHYFDPKKTQDPIQRSRALEATSLLFTPARALLARREELNNSPDLNRKLLEILDSVASRIVFSFGLPKHGVAGNDVMDSVERREHYKEVKPLLEQLLGEPNDPAPIPLIPHSAYYLLQLMNGILGIDPVRVLAFAASICEGGSHFGLELDASARDEAVELVERALADYKDTLKDSASSVGRMLDLFVKAGWSQALALTFRLDDAFRG